MFDDVDGNINLPDPVSDTIDEDKTHNPKGMSFANWMINVQRNSPLRDQVMLAQQTGRHTAVEIDATKAKRWVYLQSGANQFPQNFQFTTPNEAAPESRCGKVVFTDMHVSHGPAKTTGGAILPYPSSCGAATELSDQEKSLAFMFFDISSCVGVPF